MRLSSRISFFVVLVTFISGAGWLYGGIVARPQLTIVPSPAHRSLYVDVRGAVTHPGIYDLNEDSRVFNAIDAAGGFAAGADTANLNLAAHLYDRQHLEISFLKETEVLIPPPTSVTMVTAQASPTSTPITYSCSDAFVGSGTFGWPTDAHFLSGYGFSPEHPGIDLAAGLGSPIYTVDSGFVRSMGNDPAGYGNILEIDHGNGYSTIYAHLDTTLVDMCQSVIAGQQVGTAGETGNATGVHLHFEVIQNGLYLDPFSVLP